MFRDGRILQGQKGQSVVEYAIITALCVLIAVAGIDLLRNSLQTEYEKALTGGNSGGRRAAVSLMNEKPSGGGGGEKM